MNINVQQNMAVNGGNDLRSSQYESESSYGEEEGESGSDGQKSIDLSASRGVAPPDDEIENSMSFDPGNTPDNHEKGRGSNQPPKVVREIVSPVTSS